MVYNFTFHIVSNEKTFTTKEKQFFSTGAHCPFMPFTSEEGKRKSPLSERMTFFK